MKYDITHALQALRPGSQWVLNGDKYSGLQWMDKNDPPTEQELLDKVAELDAAEPMKMLRFERDKKIAEVDWMVIRSVSTGIALSQEWKDYMQALRDLPETSNPVIGADGRLDPNSFSWPVKPA